MTAPANAGGWKVVWVAFAVAIFGWGVGFYGPAIYLSALHQSRGWPISMVSAAVTAHFLVGAVFIAWLPEVSRRYGIGRVVFVGALLAASGAAVWGNVSQPWHLVPALILSGSGWAATSGAALNEMVAPWFEHDRPRAISVAFNGASVGGLLFAPLWNLLISTLSLAWAAPLIGTAMVAVLCPLASRHLRTGPGDRGSATPRGMPRHELFRSARFLTISLAFALGLFAQIGVFAHLISRLAPAFGESLAATAISLVTLSAILGRTLLARVLGDADRRMATAGNLVMQAAGASLLACGTGFAALTMGCILFGLGVGNLTSMPPLVAQREFAPADAGWVVALVTSINQAVFAFAPAVFGWLRDMTDSYVIAFLAAAMIQIAAAAVILGRRRFS